MIDIEITISDGIYLPKLMPSEIMMPIYQELTLKNPAYIEAIKFQRSTKSIPSEIKLFKQTDNYIRLPRGYLFHLIKKLKAANIPYGYKDQTHSIELDFPEATGDLRTYQKEAILKALKYRQGVIISPCGSGKTVMGIFFLAIASQRTLWITHTKDLMYQTIEQIGKFLSFPIDTIGKIGDGKKEIGEKVTVGLVQSLIKFDKDILNNYFGTIIIDEAHRVPSKTFQEIVEGSKAKYRLGLTATPNRKDGLEAVLYHVVGQTVYQITEADLLTENRILIPNVKKIYTKFQCFQSDYLELIKQLITSAERNQLIIKTIKETLKESEVALLLSSRVAHCSLLQQLVRESIPSLKVALLTGKVSKQGRTIVIEKARNGEVNLIIATQVADEGLDIPNLNKLFLATPSRSKSKVKQQIGRIMRNVQAKETPVVYDFIDSKVPVLRRHGNIRNVVYHELGCNIY